MSYKKLSAKSVEEILPSLWVISMPKSGMTWEAEVLFGKFVLGTANERGDRLVDFCNDNELITTNSGELAGDGVGVRYIMRRVMIEALWKALWIIPMGLQAFFKYEYDQPEDLIKDYWWPKSPQNWLIKPAQSIDCWGACKYQGICPSW